MTNPDYAAGFAAANDRLRMILGDRRVHGHEPAAIRLALEAPAMSAEAVATLVSKAVAATGPAKGLRAAVDAIVSASAPAQKPTASAPHGLAAAVDDLSAPTGTGG